MLSNKKSTAQGTVEEPFLLKQKTLHTKHSSFVGLAKSNRFCLVGKKATAQGTVEYLVIIAVVVVISLIVVGLVISQTSSVSESDKKATNLGWKTKEVQIMDFAVDAQGNGILALNSALPDSVRIDSVVIGSINNSSTKQLFLGSTPVSYTHLTLPTNREV